MGREQERIRRRLEKNPAVECNKVRQKYCPNLFQDFAGTKDPRHQSYTEYSNKERVTENLFLFMGEKKKPYLPHAVTVNEYLERLDPEELQKIQQK